MEKTVFQNRQELNYMQTFRVELETHLKDLTQRLRFPKIKQNTKPQFLTEPHPLSVNIQCPHLQGDGEEKLKYKSDLFPLMISLAAAI